MEVWILKAAHLDRRAAESIARRDADDEILRFLYIYVWLPPGGGFLVIEVERKTEMFSGDICVIFR